MGNLSGVGMNGHEYTAKNGSMTIYSIPHAHLEATQDYTTNLAGLQENTSQLATIPAYAFRRGGVWMSPPVALHVFTPSGRGMMSKVSALSPSLCYVLSALHASFVVLFRLDKLAHGHCLFSREMAHEEILTLSYGGQSNASVVGT